MATRPQRRMTPGRGKVRNSPQWRIPMAASGLRALRSGGRVHNGSASTSGSDHTPAGDAALCKAHAMRAAACQGLSPTPNTSAAVKGVGAHA